MSCFVDRKTTIVFKMKVSKRKSVLSMSYPVLKMRRESKRSFSLHLLRLSANLNISHIIKRKNFVEGLT